MTTTPNQEPLSLERAEDVLAYIPHALGFHPSCSAVFLLMAGSKLEATLRVDLPQTGGEHEPRSWVAQVCSLLTKLPQLTGTLCVFYTDQRLVDTEMPPHRYLLELLDTAMRSRGTPLREAWCVNRNQGWDYSASGSGHGHFDLARPELSPTYLKMVLAGSAPLPEPWDGRGVPRWDNASEVRQALRSLDGDLYDSLDAWSCVLDSDPYHAEKMMRGEPLVAARLLWGLQVRLVRDVLPYMAGTSSAVAADAVQALALGSEEPSATNLADYLLGRGAVTPHWERVEHLWFICRDLLGTAAGDEESALLCLLAWIEWAKGRGSMSMALLRKALDVEPGYRLAQLLQQLLYRGIMPEWATDQKRAWRAKFG